MSIKTEIYRNKKILRCLKKSRFKLNEKYIKIGKIIIMKIAQWSKSIRKQQSWKTGKKVIFT